jgi:hypothetical protein
MRVRSTSYTIPVWKYRGITRGPGISDTLFSAYTAHMLEIMAQHQSY